VVSEPAGLWCFLAFFSDLASGDGAASVVESEAVADVGVPLLVALSACDGVEVELEAEVSDVEDGSVDVDELVDEDGVVVWAVGSLTGACWAKADPAKPAAVRARTAAEMRRLIMEASCCCRVGK
jgi:hypothetical protein